MCGAVFLLSPGDLDSDFQKTAPCHLIDFVGKGQRRVVRATFTAELTGACDCVDRGILLSQLLHEVQTGDNTICTAVNLREMGGYAIPAVLYIDALSVFAAITAAFIKIPSDNGTFMHVQYIRELLDTKVLSAIVCTDTRGMAADGTTKRFSRKRTFTYLHGWHFQD